jgi:hypothetical protein
MAVCAAVAPAAEGTATVYPKVKIGGFARVRADWALSDTSTPTFSVPNARIEIKASVSDDVSYAFSMDSTAGTLKLLDSFFRINYFDWFDVKMGQFKYNFSKEQVTADADLELINKSYVVTDLVYPTREIGAELSKNFKNTPLKPFVAIGGYNGAGPNASAQNNYGAGIARLIVSPAEGLSIGGSLYDGKTGAAKVTKNRRGVEVAYENRKAGPPVLVKAEQISGSDGATDKSGYYFTAGYYVFPVSKWTYPYALLLARQDHYDANSAVADDEISRTTIGALIQYDDFFSFRINYEVAAETPSVANDLLTWQFQVKF